LDSRSERVLLGLVDFGLIMALFVVPMMLGGSHALGRFTLVLAAAIAGTAWAARQALRGKPFLPKTWAIAILVIGLMIPAVQLVPLPEAVRNLISPHLAKILPLWQPGADPATRLGTWECLSLNPSETMAGLVTFAAYSLLFVVVAGRIQTVKYLQRVLQLCGGAVLLVAVFAIVQHFYGNGKFFWFYEHPYKSPDGALSGPFPNRNHFAQFMALGIGPILIWIVNHYSARAHGMPKKSKPSFQYSSFEKPSSKKRHASTDSKPQNSSSHASTQAGQFVLAMMAGVVMFACLLSLSRGGSVALFVAILVCCGISFSVKGANRRMVGAVLMAGFILGSALMMFGYEKVCDRLGNLTSGDVELMDLEVGRRVIWETDLRASSHFPIFGTGVGTHRDVYPIFFDHVHNNRREFTHAENGYIQTLLETGGIGLLTLLAAIGLIGFWCVDGLRKSRSDSLRLCLAAIAAAIGASLFHSMTDFIWYIPGCAVMTIVIAACAFGAYRLALQEAEEPEGAAAVSRSSRKRKPMPSTGNWVAVGTVIAISFIMLQEQWGPLLAEPYWNESIRANKDSEYETVVLDDLPKEDLGKAARYFTEQIERLQKVVQYQPDHAHAHRTLAMNYLNLFEVHLLVDPNPFSLRHISDATLQSHFQSREAALEWLYRAFGKKISLLKMAQYHARRSVQACPTLGRSYLNLTELCFLDNCSFEQKMELVDQLLLVRPQCGDSILELANAAIFAGDFEQWAELSKRAYKMNVDTRRRVLSSLLDNSQTDMLPLMIGIEIQQFEPDYKDALFMIARCKKRLPEEQLVDLRRYCAAQALNGIEECEPHQQAARRNAAVIQYEKLGQLNEAFKQLQFAYQADPNSFGVRHLMARLLLKHGSPGKAMEHVQWCLRRKPGNKSLERLYQKCLAAKIEAQARAEQEAEMIR
jgi:tetratricopeptide (TPR) repeat protein